MVTLMPGSTVVWIRDPRNQRYLRRYLAATGFRIGCPGRRCLPRGAVVFGYEELPDTVHCFGSSFERLVYLTKPEDPMPFQPHDSIAVSDLDLNSIVVIEPKPRRRSMDRTPPTPQEIAELRAALQSPEARAQALRQEAEKLARDRDENRSPGGSRSPTVI